MSTTDDHDAAPHVPGADEHSIPELEVDQAVPPRPEEEIADVARSLPDPEGHGGSPDAAPTAREVP